MGPKDAQVSRQLQISAMTGSYVSYGDGSLHITRASAQKVENDDSEQVFSDSFVFACVINRLFDKQNETEANS
jgi:hypothetical protein